MKYIISHYNPSVKISDLVFHSNFIHKWRDLQFKVDSEGQIFWENFHGNFIYSQSFCQKSAEKKSPKKYFSYFVDLEFKLWLFIWKANTLPTRTRRHLWKRITAVIQYTWEISMCSCPFRTWASCSNLFLECMWSTHLK